jgi:hypothetical protein
MRDFIGTKPLKAAQMTRGAYNAHRGWTPPEGEDQDVAGYHVVYADGYQSWSPARQFEEAYQPLDAMSFGHALVMLKAGRKVARAGWNGKGMWLILVPGTGQVEPREGSPYAKAGIEVCDILPHIDMWTVNADGRRAMLPGWLASQSDMLADDWAVVD